MRKSMRSTTAGSNRGRSVRRNQPRKCCASLVRAGGDGGGGRESNAQRARSTTGAPAASAPRASAPPGPSATVCTAAATRRNPGHPSSRRPTNASKSPERSILYRRWAGRPTTGSPPGPRTRSRPQDAVSASSNSPPGGSQ
ncbi:hypothetical protein SPAR_26396 [Streptomyces sparsogenes DSM 40356]|uniref:Uncharacterized protein n=1 Tax=Streptomyces sparsogenes DSM 40356 TaxID=1331668 RepID=A0A1R1SDU0_9ACTN|nr:hypothetical protein SPAR_26396 [Streptomyces sparsogenes DSM 40356]